MSSVDYFTRKRDADLASAQRFRDRSKAALSDKKRNHHQEQEIAFIENALHLTVAIEALEKVGQVRDIRRYSERYRERELHKDIYVEKEDAANACSSIIKFIDSLDKGES